MRGGFHHHGQSLDNRHHKPSSQLATLDRCQMQHRCHLLPPGPASGIFHTTAPQRGCNCKKMATPTSVFERHSLPRLSLDTKSPRVSIYCPPLEKPPHPLGARCSNADIFSRPASGNFQGCPMTFNLKNGLLPQQSPCNLF